MINLQTFLLQNMGLFVKFRQFIIELFSIQCEKMTHSVVKTVTITIIIS